MEWLTILRQLLIAAAMSFLSYALARPKTPDAPEPETFDDFPRAEEGVGIRRVWGTAWVPMDVTWYGDEYVEPIKK